MAIALVHSRAMAGLTAVPVTIEVHLDGGLPRTTVVGLPAAAVRESKDRVRSAIRAADLKWPDGRVTVNLAPADLPKDGGRFDLPIALGVLVASDQAHRERLGELEVLGELSLNGDVRAVLGSLPCAVAARNAGRSVLLPLDNAAEAVRVERARLEPVATLLEARDVLAGRPLPERPITPLPDRAPPGPADLRDVRGQASAKRALEIAAAGSHHLLMSGPPGTGKTMLASRIGSILPPLGEEEALETASVYSVTRGEPGAPSWTTRPFRAPHHTTSAAGLIGGGSPPRPGEISLAHNGVLFLDELGEFTRFVLEALREPLESGRVAVARARAHAEYPARFQLVAAMNPCPCGYLADGSGRCRCPPEAVRRYQGRVSGPLLDRVDIHLELAPAGRRREGAEPAAEPSAAVRARVLRARARQLERQAKVNRDLDEHELHEHCRLGEEARVLLEAAIERLGLSERGSGRVLRVARTIADLAGVARLATAHLAEAITLRRFDRRL